MLFTCDMEVKDSAVSLSAALAKYMVKKNQGKEKELRVMPFAMPMTECTYCSVCTAEEGGEWCNEKKIYGWDINPDPEETGLPKDYVEGLDVVQYNEEEKCVGFLMDQPNVVGLMIAYGLRDEVEKSLDTGAPIRMMVRERKRYGRTQYIIERTPLSQCTIWDELEIWWSRWMVRLMYN